MHPLIEVSELADRLADLSVFDVRWSLTDPNHGAKTYEAGHVPGAVFVDLDKDLSSEPGPGRHPLPSPEAFATTLGRLGVDPDTDVVTYDDMGGAVAARMWWMLRSIGHRRVRLLDGGYQAWVGSGQEVETGRNTAQTSHYPAPTAFTGVVQHDELGAHQVVDVRARERYRGDREPVDPYPGHIPGAINIPIASSMDESGHFRAADVLADLYGKIPRPAISCGSGVNACHTALAMAVADLEAPAIYIGSYSEWSNLGLPVNTGDEP